MQQSLVMMRRRVASGLLISQPKRLAAGTRKRPGSSARPLASEAKPFFRYLSAWFCPFAHRATIALEHHAQRLDYEWVEALGWTRKETKEGERPDEWFYHWKSEELIKHNPSALVPTLIDVHGRSVYESLVCIDFIDAVSGATGRDRLVPDDPVEAARCRIWADKVNRECCSPYYGVLVKIDKEEQKASFQALLNGLKAFSKELEKTPGPTFVAGAQLSAADISILPWAFRYYVFEHYRGEEFVIPRQDDLAAYHEWYAHVVALPAVTRTLPDKDRYLEHIAKYASSSARSKVANAVRRGVAAHELDDELDESHPVPQPKP